MEHVLGCAKFLNDDDDDDYVSTVFLPKFHSRSPFIFPFHLCPRFHDHILIFSFDPTHVPGRCYFIFPFEPLILAVILFLHLTLASF